MSTRRERANRWWMRCPNCREWRGSVKGKKPSGHLDPWTKTYVCKKPMNIMTAPAGRSEDEETR